MVPLENRISFNANLLPLDGDNWDTIIAWLNNEYGHSSQSGYTIEKYCAKHSKIIVPHLVNHVDDQNYLSIIYSWLHRTRRYDFNGSLFDAIFISGGIRESFKKFSLVLFISDIYPTGKNNNKNAYLTMRKIIIDNHHADIFMAILNMNAEEFYHDMPEEYQLNIRL